MTNIPALVLDTNILIRAVLGRRVRHLLVTYEDHAHFFTPDVWLISAQTYLPDLARRRGWSVDETLALLRHVSHFVTSIDAALYADLEAAARARLTGRDEEDWPVSDQSTKSAAPSETTSPALAPGLRPEHAPAAPAAASRRDQCRPVPGGAINDAR